MGALRFPPAPTPLRHRHYRPVRGRQGAAYGGAVAIELREAKAYYQAALSALRFMEARQPTGRRFGADADARWSSFRGDLTTADRMDLLIRDADAQWPASLGARTVFAKAGVAEDDPFGADWEPLDPVEAEELWRATTQADPPESLRATLEAAARAWNLTLSPFNPGSIAAADKLLLVGPSAIAGTIEAFAEASDLDWADQVTVLATPPPHRQLAGLGGALLNAIKATHIVTISHAEVPSNVRLLLSDDGAEDDANKAHELVAR